MPIEHHYGGWRACLWKSNQRVRGPVRETSEKAAKDLTHLQEVYQESLAALQARETAMTAEAISSKSCNAGEQLQQTVVCTISQWLRQGHCNSLSRATPALRALATRARRLESIPAFSGLWDSAKALVCEHLAISAFSFAWTTAAVLCTHLGY